MSRPLVRERPTPGRPLRREDEGFVLVEALLALSVLFLALLGLYASLYSTHRLSETNRDRYMAIKDVDSLMEQISTMPMNVLTSTFAHDQAIPEFDDLHLRDQAVRVRYEGGNPNRRPLEYEVVCTWLGTTGAPASLVKRGIRAR